MTADCEPSASDTQRAHATPEASRNVRAGGNISGGIIVTGDGNTISPPAAPAEQPAPAAPLTLLFLAANPGDTDRLRLDEEARAVDAAIRQAPLRDRFDLRSHWAVQVDDLQELLLRYQPAIVHFSGHGSPAGAIMLTDAQRGYAPVAAKTLAALFGALQADVRLVVLNACHSAQQATAIAAHVDCVVGTPDAMTDGGASRFAAALYRALAYGQSVAAAFELGLAELALHGEPEPLRPQLYGKADPALVRFVAAPDC